MAFIKSFFSSIFSIFKSGSSSSSGSPSTSASKWNAEWTEFIKGLVALVLSRLDKASDRKELNPYYDIMSVDEKLNLWAEFFKALAYYESAYNPNSASVDVGVKNNKDTWSIGLLQLSVIDQSNLGIRLGLDYNSLLDPFNNLKLGVLIMANQIDKRGKILIPKGEKGNPGVYWATLNPGNIYDKSKEILKVVNALDVFNELKDLPASVTPWMDVAEKELGISEVAGNKHNPRIVEYHSATTLKATDDETAWCASFVCWVLEKSGYKSTKSAWARDYVYYGTKLDGPKFGCIVVFKRGTNSGHVGFWMSESNGNVKVLGGNQNNKVCFKNYSKSDVLGYRWPVK